jgi:hypothetical protein
MKKKDVEEPKKEIIRNQYQLRKFVAKLIMTLLVSRGKATIKDQINWRQSISYYEIFMMDMENIISEVNGHLCEGKYIKYDCSELSGFLFLENFLEYLSKKLGW